MNTLYKTPFVYLKSVPINVLQSGEQDKEEGHVGEGQEWPKTVSALLTAKTDFFFFCYLPTDQSIIKYVLIKYCVEINIAIFLCQFDFSFWGQMPI